MGVQRLWLRIPSGSCTVAMKIDDNSCIDITTPRIVMSSCQFGEEVVTHRTPLACHSVVRVVL